jgi:LuxR family maltose regulon positive regulatory protein
VRLVLVSAPAGFGKTTLLASWCHALAEQGAGAVAWLTLEASENDPARFLAYLAAALAPILQPAAGDTRAQLPRGGSADEVLTSLLNGLASCGGPCIVVLDDYHVITAPAVHAAVAFLLDHIPEHVCLALGSRADPPLPLARLRARSELLELRAADLCFTEDETRAFFQAVAALDLPDTALRALRTYAEGWPAGLQLLALALRARPWGEGHPDDVRSPALIARLAGSERLVFAYLADEVFAQQPSDVQRFLLHVAVLDRLHGPLCAALLRDSSGGDKATLAAEAHAVALLEALEQANVFIQPLDADRRWFRFHPLFQAFLRARLEREPELSVATLHRRAAEWYRQEAMPTQAIDHLLAAGDVNEAAALIDALAAPLVAGGEYATLHAWLDHIPLAAIEARPQLRLWAAWSALLSGEVERITPLLATAEAEWQSAHDPAHLGEVAHLRAHLARLQHDPGQTLHWAQQALAQLPPDKETLRAGAELALGAGQLLAGDLTSAQAVLETSLDDCRQHNELGSLVALVCLGDLAAQRGDLDGAKRRYDATIAAVGDRALWERWQASVRLGEIARERNALEQAALSLETALLNAERSGVAIYLAAGYVALARTRWAQGDEEAARRALEHGLRHAQRLGSETYVRQLEAWQARFALAQRDRAAVASWQAAITARLGQGASAIDEVEALTLVRVLLASFGNASRSHALRTAHGLLVRLQERAEGQGRVASMIEILVLAALVAATGGQQAEAMLAMGRALTLAAPGRFLRLFLDEGAPVAVLITQAIARADSDNPVRAFGELVLAAFAAERGGAARTRERSIGGAAADDERTWYCEPLSERELEVLRLVAEGASNKTIADALVVSVGTVKSHLNHLLGKLAAHSRTEAVARARALGLLA